MAPRNQQTSNESRYQRQAALLQNQGWDQSKLENSKIAVVGSDALANYTALTLSAFGFGNIELYGQGKVDDLILNNYQRTNDFDYSNGFLFFEAERSKNKAKALEEIIGKINPEIDFKGINLGLQRSENCELIKKPDLIIDTTNDSYSKLSLIDHALVNDIPLISMSAGTHKGGVGIINYNETGDQRKLLENLLFSELNTQKQDPIVSQVIAGIGVEEARKIINPLQGEHVINDLIIYNLLSNSRFDHQQDKIINDDFDLSNYSVCLIGAGALGNFVGLGLALRNIGNLAVVDFDVTETTNLNRQILLYDSVGREKSSALVQKLKKINPRGNYRAKVDKIVPSSSNFFSRNKFDLIIDTVDNNKTRALLNYFSLKYDIPFISGGTRYNSGQVNICIPKETGCLNCQADIDNLALGNYQRQSCIYAAQPSVITSNQITGGLIVGEVPSVLNSELYGDFARGEAKFVSNEEFRLSLLPPAVDNCNCYKNDALLKDWGKKMHGVYD